MPSMAQQRLLKIERRTVRATLRAYEQARAEIAAQLLSAYADLGSDPDAMQLQRMLRDTALLRGIEAQMEWLEGAHAGILREGAAEAGQEGLSEARKQIEKLAKELNVSAALGVGLDTRAIELASEVAVARVPGLVGTVRAQVLGELRSGLIRGDGFPELVRRLIGKNITQDGASIFRRGKVSAELMTRRAVIEANNASRHEVYNEAKSGIPGLKRQAVAALGPDTTLCCLRVHGQIVEVDEPFELTGTPRFARKMMYPPFHWNCRTSAVAWHEVFEGGKMGTDDMRQAARDELKDR